MPRPRRGFQIVTQTHLERMDTEHWRLNISDGVHFFPAKHIRSYVIGRKALAKLKQQIEKEINDGR